MSMQHVRYMLLFLVLVVNFTFYMLLLKATCSYALLLPAIRYSLGGMNAGGNKLTLSVQEPTKTDEHWIGEGEGYNHH